MDKRFILSSESQKQQRSITMVLASALLEWLLIAMLFAYGLFGYLIAKFAYYCELPIPCLLCSRIDHILGSEKAGFYLDMLCGNHKLEISSLVYCHFHGKLVDVRGMCESCLFSFATKNKSNAETYRLLVGKLGEEDISGFDDNSITNDHKSKKFDMKHKHCSCCNELWTKRGHGQTLILTKSTGFDEPDLDLTLSREINQNQIDMKKEIISFHRKTEDSIAQYGYTELKVTSDSESEIQMLDGEDMSVLISNDPLRDLVLDSTPMKPFEEEIVSDKPIDMDILSSEPSEKLYVVPSDTINPSDGRSEPPASATIGHGLEELDWPEMDKVDLTSSIGPKKFDIILDSTNNESISIDKSNIEDAEILPQNVDVKDSKELDIKEFGVMETSVHVSDKPQELESVKLSTDFDGSESRSEHNKDGGLQISNQLELGDAYTLAVSSRGRHYPENIEEPENVDVKDSNKLDIKESGVTETLVHVSDKPQVLESVKFSTDLDGSESRSEHNKDPGLQISNQLELGDAYKLAVSSRGRQFSGKESPRISSDLKLLLSQWSRGSDFPASDLLSPSPRPSRNLDELKSSDSSTSIGLKLLQKRISLERNDSKASSIDRNESGFESLDFSTISEIEGESEVDRLKRQLDHDRKLLISLVKELEEERNASAISANETMAMITRLQEEKAALEMEASHDLRMLEDQAEYDMEALDKLNERLIEKEKEIQDLEAELEYYRTHYPNELGVENVRDSSPNTCPNDGGLNYDNALVNDLKSSPQESLLEDTNERMS